VVYVSGYSQPISSAPGQAAKAQARSPLPGCGGMGNKANGRRLSCARRGKSNSGGRPLFGTRALAQGLLLYCYCSVGSGLIFKCKDLFFSYLKEHDGLSLQFTGAVLHPRYLRNVFFLPVILCFPIC
jgi:hypothetical protein